jgi:outer membrane protein TolC
MKLKMLLAFLCILLAAPAWGETGGTTVILPIGKLLDAAAHHPNVEISELAARESNLRVQAATAALYPKVDLFAKAESYNSPTNLRPMAPTEVNVAGGDAVPFSRKLAHYGLSFQAPLYIAKIYRLREKMKLLAQKSAIARQINLVSREAAVVALNSSYHYLDRLNQAVDARLKSLAKTRADVALQVKNGRTAEAELMKIDNIVIALEEQKNDLADKILNVQRDMEKFTALTITAPANMALAAAPTASQGLIGVKLQETALAAQKKEAARVRAERWPSLALYGTVSGNDGEAYNTDSHIFRSYNFIGLGLTMPLFDQTLSRDEDIAEVQTRKAAKKLRDTEIELTALDKNLKNRLPIVAKSRHLASESTKNNEQLLKIARVAYDSGRTTTEEYLRYEAQVLAAQADLARAVDAKWQIITKQAVLYGTDLRGVVK